MELGPRQLLRTTRLKQTKQENQHLAEKDPLQLFHFIITSHFIRSIKYKRKMQQRQTILFIGFSSLLSLWRLDALVTAFASPSSLHLSSRLRAGSDDFSELTSALARLDQQWNIQQKQKGNKSRWSKLILPRDPDQKVVEESPSTSLSTNPEDFVWILEPPASTIPSCVIVFTGGAGLGQFPHIAYNELLSRVSDRLNAVCIAAPYQVGLDHFSLAKQTGERIRRALVYCEDDPSRQYPPNLPTYCLAHSLGCKLQTIYVGATGQQFDGMGFMAFNNFSFGQTITMARTFAQQIRKNSGGNDPLGKIPLDNEEILNTIFAFAENVVGVIGVDFTPNARDTERLIQLRFDDVLQAKTRLFVFDEDNLDNSKEFVLNCSGGSGPTAAGLPGGHLTPVFFKFGFDDLDINDLPPQTKDMAREAMGGFQSASFGNEVDLEELVDEVANWILGKPPKRAPRWDAKARNESPKLVEFSGDQG